MPRRVCDVMTTEVVSASPETPYKELVRLLVDHKISALPVVDDRHHAVGVVSEADLLLKEELPVDGVVRVQNRLGFDVDDTTTGLANRGQWLVTWQGGTDWHRGGRGRR
jgi:CBS-domain-containing membrane protein